MLSRELFEKMRNIGFLLESRGLILSARSGNISVRVGDFVYIKRSGAMMGHLNVEDIVEVEIQEDSHKSASVEYKVHRAIYLNTEFTAVIHTHSPYAIVESMCGEDIEPVDAEGRYYFERIPVLDVEEGISSDEVAEKLPSLVKKYGVAIVKAHGTFSAAKSLEEAFSKITEVESACKLRYLWRLARCSTG